MKINALSNANITPTIPVNQPTNKSKTIDLNETTKQPTKHYSKEIKQPTKKEIRMQTENHLNHLIRYEEGIINKMKSVQTIMGKINKKVVEESEKKAKEAMVKSAKDYKKSLDDTVKVNLKDTHGEKNSRLLEDMEKLINDQVTALSNLYYQQEETVKRLIESSDKKLEKKEYANKQRDEKIEQKDFMEKNKERDVIVEKELIRNEKVEDLHTKEVRNVLEDDKEDDIYRKKSIEKDKKEELVNTKELRKNSLDRMLEKIISKRKRVDAIKKQENIENKILEFTQSLEKIIFKEYEAKITNKVYDKAGLKTYDKNESVLELLV